MADTTQLEAPGRLLMAACGERLEALETADAPLLCLALRGQTWLLGAGREHCLRPGQFAVLPRGRGRYHARLRQRAACLVLRGHDALPRPPTLAPRMRLLAQAMAAALHDDMPDSAEWRGWIGMAEALAATPVEPPPPDWLAGVLAHIEAHPGDALRVEELAAMAGLSPAHFARSFQQATGCTPGLHVARRRITFAAQRLRHGRESLAEIALAAGFGDQASFTVAFRRHMGMPPGRWRRLGG